jgi:hypothetical protein
MSAQFFPNSQVFLSPWLKNALTLLPEKGRPPTLYAHPKNHTPLNHTIPQYHPTTVTIINKKVSNSQNLSYGQKSGTMWHTVIQFESIFFTKLSLTKFHPEFKDNFKKNMVFFLTIVVLTP